MIVIRKAQRQEARHLGAVEQDAATLFRTAPGFEWLADAPGTNAETYALLVEGGFVWVAVEQDQICGFLAARREDRDLHVVELGVRRDRQRRGIAAQLFEGAKAEARDARLEAMTLTTFRDLPWNAPFYARLGFVLLEEREIGGRLTAELKAEAASGLPVKRRCAMRLALSSATAPTAPLQGDCSSR